MEALNESRIVPDALQMIDSTERWFGLFEQVPGVF
jgi:hypothetical protein